MPQLRVALAQVNPVVGDLEANMELILERSRWALEAEAEADLIAFPEMALTGYPVEDLVLRESFQQASKAALVSLAEQLAQYDCGSLTVIVGYLDTVKGKPVNAAAFLHGGKVVTKYFKQHLPNYGVFDEKRTFVPGNGPTLVRVKGVDVAVIICEDLWETAGPVEQAAAAGAGLIVSINASPYEQGKAAVREALVSKRTEQAGCAIAYVNTVGGQDELVFDGASFVTSADGVIVAQAQQFVEHLLITDLELPSGAGDITYSGVNTLISRLSVFRNYTPMPSHMTKLLDPMEEVYEALVVGLRDYVQKNGFKSVTLGLSGGIDSALTAAIACDALGAHNVYTISMPSKYSSEHSKGDAHEMAEATGMHYSVVPIEPMMFAFLSNMTLTGVAEENLQARIRGIILMGQSNQHGHLVLATGNKSELAVGYSTLYGDAVGAYAPLKDVPKTLVFKLAEWRNTLSEVIPVNSIEKPPSAELRPDQQDSDSLPDYDVLDAVLELYVVQDKSAAEIVAEGFDKALVEKTLRMVDLAEYKRRQYPPGPKISTLPFGRDRRMPITNRWREKA